MNKVSCMIIVLTSLYAVNQAYPRNLNNEPVVLNPLENDLDSTSSAQLHVEPLQMNEVKPGLPSNDEQKNKEHTKDRQTKVVLLIPRSIKENLDDLDTAEAIIFRPLFVYRKYTVKRRRGPRF